MRYVKLIVNIILFACFLGMLLMLLTVPEYSEEVKWQSLLVMIALFGMGYFFNGIN